MRMLKCLPVMLALALGACTKADDTDDGAPTLKRFSLSVYDPTGIDPNFPDGALPFPNDLLFAGFNDPTLNIPNPGAVPFVDAANLTDGFSTTASIFFDFSANLDLDSVAGGLLFINAATGAVLQPGVDFTLQLSPVVSNSRVLIEPLRPLAPSTQYILAVTTNARSVDGLPVVASDVFKVVRSGTPVAEQSAPILVGKTEAQIALLEQVRSSAIRPVVEALIGLAGLSEEQIAIAWSFTTQSIGNTLSRLEANAVAGDIFATPTGQTTGQALEGAGLIPAGAGATAPFNNSDVFVGYVELPYFLAAGTHAQDTGPLTSFFAADPAQPDTDASFLGRVPCGAFAAGVTLPDGQTAQPSASTTVCFPVPVQRSTQRVPMIVTVPNADSGLTKPANGWPVVIYQHGITSNRSTVLAVAPALAAAGFVTVAIDLPLHGLPPGHPLRTDNTLGTTERTFDLDLVNNDTSAPGPDGTADASGTHYLNLASLATARDNLRQSIADHFTLVESLANLDLDGNPFALQAGDIDESRIGYLGISLGSIVGTGSLAFDDGIGAASLSVPGGGIAKLLDASKAFGPVVTAGLAAAGVTEGTDDFETYLRFAQHLVDPGDPINHIAAAVAKHNVHLTKVIGDLVVPNNALANDGSGSQDPVSVSGFLSGTDPLISIGGFDLVGPVTAPVAEGSVNADPAGLDIAIEFTSGSHASLLSPAASADVTAEMQRQSANFLASGGTCLPVGTNCPQ